MEGEGMVAVVRGLNDARLAVTLLEGDRQYTLMPNAGNNASEPHSGVRLVGTTRNPKRMESGGDLGHQRDSSAQAIDGRFTTTYRSAHCHERPTSPPYELTEFPPQRPDLCNGHSNFQVGGLGSGETFVPSKSSGFRGGMTWTDRGAVCNPRASHELDSFANSLRKYPHTSPERCSEIFERLVNYSRGRLNRSPNRTSSPRLEETSYSSVQPNRNITDQDLNIRTKKYDDYPTRDSPKYQQYLRYQDKESQWYEESPRYQDRESRYQDNRYRNIYDVRYVKEARRGREKCNQFSYNQSTCTPIKEACDDPPSSLNSCNSTDMQVQAGVQMVSRESATSPRQVFSRRTDAIHLSPSLSSVERRSEGLCCQLPTTQTAFKCLQTTGSFFKINSDNHGKFVQTAASSINIGSKSHQNTERKSKSQEEIRSSDYETDLSELLETISHYSKNNSVCDEVIKERISVHSDLGDFTVRQDSNPSIACHCDNHSVKNISALAIETKSEKIDVILKHWLYSLHLKQNDFLGRPVDRNEVVNTAVENIKPIICSSRNDINKKSQIVEILEDLPILLNDWFNKVSYIDRFVELLLKELKILRSNSNEIIKNLENKAHVTVEVLKNEIREHLLDFFDSCNVKISEEYLNNLETNLASTVSNSIDAIQYGLEDYVKNKMAIVLQQCGNLTERESVFISNVILRNLKVLLDSKFNQTYAVFYSGINNTHSGYDTNNFSINSINEVDINANLYSYTRHLSEKIEEWLNTLKLSETVDSGFRKVVVNDLAGDIVDRHKYLELNPDLKGSDEDELKTLKFQIFKWINKLVGEDNTDTLDHANDLMRLISSVPVPTLTRPLHRANQSVKCCENSAGLCNSLVNNNRAVPNESFNPFEFNGQNIEQLSSRSSISNGFQTYENQSINILNSTPINRNITQPSQFIQSYPHRAPENNVISSGRQIIISGVPNSVQIPGNHLQSGANQSQITPQPINSLISNTPKFAIPYTSSNEGSYTQSNNRRSSILKTSSCCPTSMPATSRLNSSNVTLPPCCPTNSVPISPSLKQLQEDYDKYLKQWVEQLPIPIKKPSDQKVAEETKLHIYNSIWKTLTKLQCDPDVSRNPYYAQDVLDDELEELMSKLPKSDDRNHLKPLLKSELLRKTSEMNEKIARTAAPASFKQQLIQNLDNNFPKLRRITDTPNSQHEIAEVQKINVAEDFILYTRYKNKDNFKSNIHSHNFKQGVQKLANTVKNNSQINSRTFANEIIEAVTNVPIPDEITIQEEADEITIGKEVDSWLSDLPLTSIISPLQQRRTRDAIVKKILDLKKVNVLGSCSSTREFKNEIPKILGHYPLDDNVDLMFLIEELANRLKKIPFDSNVGSLQEPQDYNEFSRNLIGCSSYVESRGQTLYIKDGEIADDVDRNSWQRKSLQVSPPPPDEWFSLDQTQLPPAIRENFFSNQENQASNVNYSNGNSFQRQPIPQVQQMSTPNRSFQIPYPTNQTFTPTENQPTPNYGEFNNIPQSRQSHIPTIDPGCKSSEYPYPQNQNQTIPNSPVRQAPGPLNLTHGYQNFPSASPQQTYIQPSTQTQPSNIPPEQRQAYRNLQPMAGGGLGVLGTSQLPGPSGLANQSSRDRGPTTEPSSSVSHSKPGESSHTGKRSLNAFNGTPLGFSTPNQPIPNVSPQKPIRTGTATNRYADDAKKRLFTDSEEDSDEYTRSIQSLEHIHSGEIGRYTTHKLRYTSSETDVLRSSRSLLIEDVKSTRSRHCSIKTKSQENLNNNLVIESSDRNSATDVKYTQNIDTEIAEWLNKYTFKSKLKQWKHKLKLIAEKLAIPGEEEKLKLKIQKYLDSMPGEGSDSDENMAILKKQLPNEIVQEIKKIYLQRKKKNHNNSKESSYKRRMKFLNNSLTQWIETLLGTNEDLNNSVTREDVLSYFLNNLLPLVSNVNKNGIKDDQTMRTKIIEVLNNSPTAIKNLNTKQLIEQLLDILIQTQNVSKSPENRQVKSLLIKEVNEFVKERVNDYFNNTNINIGGKIIKRLNTRLVKILQQSNDDNIVENLIDEILNTLSRTAKIPENEVKTLIKALISDYKLLRSHHNFHKDSGINAIKSNIYTMYHTEVADHRSIDNKEIKMVTEVVKQWLADHNIDVINNNLLEILLNELAKDILRRQTYINTYCNNNDEIENFKYLIFKWTHKSIGNDVTKVIDSAHILLEKIKLKLQHVKSERSSPKRSHNNNPTTYTYDLINEIYDWFNQLPMKCYFYKDISTYKEQIEGLAESIEKSLVKDQNVIKREVNIWAKEFDTHLSSNDIANLILRLNNIPYSKAGVAKDLYHEKIIVRRNEDLIDEWLVDTVPLQKTEQGTSMATRNECIHELAVKLYNIMNKHTKSVANDMLLEFKEEILVWMENLPILKNYYKEYHKNQMVDNLLNKIQNNNYFDTQINSDDNKIYNQEGLKDQLSCNTSTSNEHNSSNTSVDVKFNNNIASYTEQLVKEISEWFEEININNTGNNEYKHTIVDEIVKDVLDRLKYLNLNSNSQATLEDFAYLKYKIHKCIKNIMNDNTDRIKNINKLINRIREIPIPATTKFQNETTEVYFNTRPVYINVRKSNTQRTIQVTNVTTDNAQGVNNLNRTQTTSNINARPENNNSNFTHQNILEAIYDKYTAIIKQKCDDLPIDASTPEEKQYAKLGKIGIFNGIMKAYFHLHVDPEISRDYNYFQFLIEGRIDELLDIMPQTDKMVNFRRDFKSDILSNIINLLKEVHNATDKMSYKQKLQNQFNKRSLARDLAQKEDIVQRQNFLNEAANTYILMVNYQEKDPLKANVYRQRLKNKAEAYIQSLENKHNVPFKIMSGPELMQNTLKLFNNVPIPNDDILQEEINEILIEEEVQKWYKQLPVKQTNSFEEGVRKRMMHLLAKKLHEIEKASDHDDKDMLMKQEISLFIDKRIGLQPGQDLNINVMVDQLNYRVKNRWMNELKGYEEFEEGRPKSSSLAQEKSVYNPNPINTNQNVNIDVNQYLQHNNIVRSNQMQSQSPPNQPSNLPYPQFYPGASNQTMPNYFPEKRPYQMEVNQPIWQTTPIPNTQEPAASQITSQNRYDQGQIELTKSPFQGIKIEIRPESIRKLQGLHLPNSCQSPRRSQVRFNIENSRTQNDESLNCPRPYENQNTDQRYGIRDGESMYGAVSAAVTGSSNIGIARQPTPLSSPTETGPEEARQIYADDNTNERVRCRCRDSRRLRLCRYFCEETVPMYFCCPHYY